MYLGLDKHLETKTALLDAEGVSLSYGELTRFAEKLKIKLNLNRSVVFAFAKNSTGFVAWLIALLEAGAIPLLLPHDLPEDLKKELDEEYQPAYYLTAESEEEGVNGEMRDSFMEWSLIRTGYSQYPTAPNLELLLSTSGSTGSPKLVRFGRGNMENNAANVKAAFGWTAVERGICSLPLNYVMGLNVLMTHLYSGATALLTDLNLMEQGFWDFIKRNQATNFTGVPFSYEVLRRLKLERMDLPHLKTFAQGGGKLSENTFRKMSELAKELGWSFIATYGTTETSARCSLLPPALATAKTLSIGRAIPNVSLHLVDDEGQRIREPHRVGNLLITGNNVAMGYAVKKEDLLLGDQWQGTYVSGDLARFDEDGFYYITGRKKRFVKLLGNRIGLDESELILKNKFGMEVACIGKEDSLIIICEDDATSGELKAYLSAKLKLRPSLFSVYSTPAIPRNDFGKILYRQLEEDYL